MKVVLSRAAHADIAAIGDFIANDNPPRAATFVDELKQHCLEIGLAPYAHPVVISEVSAQSGAPSTVATSSFMRRPKAP